MLDMFSIFSIGKFIFALLNPSLYVFYYIHKIYELYRLHTFFHTLLSVVRDVFISGEPLCNI